MDDPMPWAAMIDGYLTELAAAGRPASTIGLRREQLSYLGRAAGVPPGAVSRPVLVSVFAAQGWAPQTRRSYRSAVRGFFGWAVATGLLTEDPAARLPVVHTPPGLPRPVPDAVYAAALAGAGARVALMLRCAAEAGLRRAEIASLRGADVCDSPAGPSLLVHGKGGKDRVIPIGAGLAADLRGGGPGWVFASVHGGPVSARWVGHMCADALGGGWTLHGLRHSFATRAYAASRDLRAVQLLLGHTSPAITQRYVAVADTDLRAVMAAANTAIPTTPQNGAR